MYVLIIICVPRIYLGLHYPTDILTGAAVGIVLTLALASPGIWRSLTSKVMLISFKYSSLFYLLFFLISFEIASMFDSLRSIIHLVFAGFYVPIIIGLFIGSYIKETGFFDKKHPWEH